eukprot:CAMPEP_0183737562 /NCGR_PEP_ID=MMETSP0737-20130205/52343_1 /TAXON_ID=385413 /ORGANISM="Thalassiosira miniscula, Strain CCMP1093" /LENGTH=407 /DNA_ID=CAMNT_0025971871 /DNA_START=29 /DNA_END=1249 /DNA_ORIENTATION=-
MIEDSDKPSSHATSDAASKMKEASLENNGNVPPSPPPAGTTDALTSPGSAEARKTSITEPPRWRFVNTAKKSMGYSSFAAGTVVKGKSAQELVGSYSTDENIAIESTIDNVKETAADIESPTKENKKEMRTVGKLNIQEKDEESDEIYEGTFGGFRKKKSEEYAQEKDTAEEDGQTTDELPMEEEDALDSALEVTLAEKEVMKDSVVTEQIPSAEKTSLSEKKLDDSPIEPGVATMEATPTSSVDLEAMAKPAPTGSNGTAQPEEEEDKPPIEEQNPPNNKRRKCLLLLILLIVVVAIALGVVLGGKKSEDENNGDGSNSVIDNNEVISGNNTNPTNAPTASTLSLPTNDPSSSIEESISPTMPPSMSCPANTKLFTVEHNQNNNNMMEQLQEQYGTNFTWVVRDAC